MPLAVAAVAEATGVPFSELSRLVAMLNQADVAPVQFEEVLRYAPVALVAEGEPGFVQFVHTQVVDEGVKGPSLVRVIEQRLRTFDVTPQIALVPRSEVTVVDQNFFPPPVRTRMAARRGHPHGGPPGQLKKAAGVQTGVEIVHGEHPAARVTPKRPEGRGGPRIDPPGQRKGDERSMSGAQPQGGLPPGHSKGAGQGGGKGKRKGKG
ncbi:MAG TPA: hypothetical protein VNA04_13240 [Thermoanaerobaculia bacterium]|nr:hypothetical protein [Thermoanaerobaculia bacterium]